MKKSIICLFAATILLSSCADVMTVSDVEAPKHKLNKKGSAIVYKPEDGSYSTQTYAHSGAMTQKAVMQAVALHMSNVHLAKERLSLDKAIAVERENKKDYLIYPEIMQWEDRATEWSGKPDVVKVRVHIINLKTGEPISVAIINGTSGLWTFGGDHPQDLLPKPLQDYFSKLF